jgi:hypothetical protein
VPGGSRPSSEDQFRALGDSSAKACGGSRASAGGIAPGLFNPELIL